MNQGISPHNTEQSWFSGVIPGQYASVIKCRLDGRERWQWTVSGARRGESGEAPTKEAAVAAAKRAKRRLWEGEKRGA